MRLTVNLESDLYALAKSLSKAEDCTISAAVNRLLRRTMPGGEGKRGTKNKPLVRNGITVSRGRIAITDDLVKQMEMEDDQA